MIRILMKKQLKMLFSGFFVDRKTGKSRPKGAVVALLSKRPCILPCKCFMLKNREVYMNNLRNDSRVYTDE